MTPPLVSRTLGVRDRVAAAIVAAFDDDAGLVALRDLARTGEWPVDEVAAIVRRLEIAAGAASAYRASAVPGRAAPLACALAKSARLFDAGLFFEVHEVLEDAWHDLDGPERSAVQGLIQIAVALHHLAHGNPRGAASLFAAGREKLTAHRPRYLGVDVAALLDGLDAWEAAVAAGAWPSDATLPPFRV
jgi:hypothetical protein